MFCPASSLLHFFCLSLLHHQHHCSAFPPPLAITLSPLPSSALASNVSFHSLALTQPTGLIAFVVVVLFAFLSGVPEHLIKLHGDWRSDAYCAYLALPLETCSQVTDIMTAGLFPISHYWCIWNNCLVLIKDQRSLLLLDQLHQTFGCQISLPHAMSPLSATL